MIYLADKIKEQLGTGNFDCETFVDFQGKFDIVDHEIVILKLNYYGVHFMIYFIKYLKISKTFDFG